MAKQRTIPPVSMREIPGYLRDRCVEVGECIEWTGRYNDRNKPIICIGDGKTARVSRELFLALVGGPLPRGHCVYVTCGNPRCIAHITSGPLGRQVVASLKGRPLPLAQRISCTIGRQRAGKYTHQQVQQVRDLLAAGYPGIEVSAMTGVDKSSVSKIKLGQMRRIEPGLPSAGHAFALMAMSLI